MERDELKETVFKILVSEHDMSTEDAEEAVETSLNSRPELWHENTDPKDLANFLASDDDDD